MAETIVGWGMSGIVIVIVTKEELLPASTKSVRKALPWRYAVDHLKNQVDEKRPYVSILSKYHG